MKGATIDGDDIAQARHLPMDERSEAIIGVRVSQLVIPVQARGPHSSVVFKNGTEEQAGGNGGDIRHLKMRGKK
jgi:hypothetical protein